MSSIIIDLLQLKRTTASNRTQYTPKDGEPVYEKDTSTLYMGDGKTPGGNPLGFTAEGVVSKDNLAVFADASGSKLKALTKASLLSGYATQTWVTQQLNAIKTKFQSKVLSGTSNPSPSLGANGDVYVQYK